MDIPLGHGIFASLLPLLVALHPVELSFDRLVQITKAHSFSITHTYPLPPIADPSPYSLDTSPRCPDCCHGGGARVHHRISTPSTLMVRLSTELIRALVAGGWVWQSSRFRVMSSSVTV